ncbi:MAG TPA: UDP-N-acetylglucosamine--N-acetylmuramyl-(pentapeptide) pyrophosphoryl-undecaprenol N-acetylglucosamine transferase [bacterium]|jgi:UDP-N-acetylglucosamine--N-acetylmuramyl-(pentapeptide) pyrophosphoryl-undecaprenol N-acetylglucosamine transferase|nr:UDP-N-acetylglucosamine--N-acetylmuramyl-(pentapeptide) pyrophosphoryl-undecaprenol N-acetylglucosamine transferase [bacterium]HOG38217.1 UDP-N-acetylglucosamine--N-acetylmuramyl-(pentapeptide) pyrophosphoryl-undecaprenol N-acetylglucosamine transferase [bacterium]HQI03193.1 UDP-N-acetylglucosamine--N-acetylmuramyl-(pentapeptide) pyrophosphoryl-undecaprenol N-acetylglucosamine transferase [bacterium]
MRLLFSGGGTLGPVTPLVAIINEIRKNHKNDEIFWVSTKNGIENNYLNTRGIKTHQISSAKLRRYVSIYNILDIFNFTKALFESYRIIKKINPDIIISAGAYVSVPLVIMGRLMNKKILIHQQDVRIGLANKIMKFFADKITVTFPEQLQYFGENAVLTGNPSRFTGVDILNLSKEKIKEKYCFNSKPILLILGGSSGALTLNDKIYQDLDKLIQVFQVIHSTGENKNYIVKKQDYYQYSFLDKELLEFMFLADIIVSRAGMATLSELSFLSKASIIVPLPGHQEENAKYFAQHEAVDNSELNNLTENIFSLHKNQNKKSLLEKNINNIMPHDSIKRIIFEIYGS